MVMSLSTRMQMEAERKPVVVLAHGCFDLLHVGHIRHLQQARKMGDKLVVSVTADENVAKGLGRPHFTTAQRCEALLALECVDEVVVSNSGNAVHVIQTVKPDIYIKGVDYRINSTVDLDYEQRAVEKIGGRLEFTDSEKFSSSRLINSERFAPDVVEYLDRCRAAGFRDAILNAFDEADKLTVAFVGEEILDEYRYVRGLGRASKELMLAVEHTGTELFEGGVIAAAKHAEWLTSEVVTVSSHVRKTRYVDADFNRKILDVYSDTQLRLSDEQREVFRTRLSKIVKAADVVVAFDFGHGLLLDVDREELNVSHFLAVNSQTNAGNYGFNPVTKYSRADLVCVDDPEARLATSMAEEPIRDVLRYGLSPEISCNCFIVTHGRHGSVYLDLDGDDFGITPAFAAGGVDTLGAGDAVMATVAPLVAAGLPLKMAAFVGNVAGAIKTTIVGHRTHVTRQQIVQTVESLLA